MTADPRKVFIIHGRDMEPVRGMGTFLRALALEPLLFSDVRSEIGGTPTILEIVSKGMTAAHAVITLLTPDERAELRPDLQRTEDHARTISRWQPRPNVLFEMGMAFARDRTRVVVAMLGEVELPSDIVGIHVLRPTNDPRTDRASLRGALTAMGCPISTSSAWMTEGDLECASPAGLCPQSAHILPPVALSGQEREVLAIFAMCNVAARGLLARARFDAARNGLAPSTRQRAEQLLDVLVTKGLVRRGLKDLELLDAGARVLYGD